MLANKRYYRVTLAITERDADGSSVADPTLSVDLDKYVELEYDSHTMQYAVRQQQTLESQGEERENGAYHARTRVTLEVPLRDLPKAAVMNYVLQRIGLPPIA